MKFTFKKYLIRVMIIIVSFFIAVNIYANMTNQNKPVQIIQPTESVSSSEYIISEQAIMSNLKQQAQIVSMKQEIKKTDTKVDTNWLGERHTELEVHGTYKLGLNTSDITIKHINQDTRTVYVGLGKPILISLELPYNELKFEKTQGFFRLASTDEEKKNFYKSTEKNIEKEIMKDKEVIKLANINNQEVVKDILMKIQGIKYIVFE